MSHHRCIMQTVWGLLLVCTIAWASEPIIMELEASIHSSLLMDIQPSIVSDPVAVVGQIFRMRIPLVSQSCHDTDIGLDNETETPGFRQRFGYSSPAVYIDPVDPDGQIWWKQENIEILMYDGGSATLPAWLYWDNQLCLLQGLPLEGDKGLYRFSLSPAAIQGPDGSIHTHLLLRGTKLSDNSYTNIHEPDVFIITVNPEDQQEAESAPAMLHSQSNATTACVCSTGQPVTTVTIILDADLTKMNSRARLELLQKMSKFANEPPELMRVMPVVNNRFFDMSAFMAGPGNAKKVVENGALLSWKLGCALDHSNLPDISGVQLPAKDGTMSALLGYPVVGWYIVNKKPHVVKRIKRQIYNTPTPVPTQFPPATHPEPAERIVPAPATPFIATNTDLFLNPARGPLPLPVKPTIRIRDQVAYTPVLGHPLPTRVLGSTSTLPLQPTLTYPGYVGPTASVTPPTTRRPKTSTSKKGKKPKVPPTPKVQTTEKSSEGPLPSQKPYLPSPIDKVNVWVGTYFEVKIPANTLFDQEDGITKNLRLSVHQIHNRTMEENSWIQFNSTSHLIYGLPDQRHVGRHEFIMMAMDNGYSSTTCSFVVQVNSWSIDDQTPVVFIARFLGEPEMLTNDIHKKMLLSKKLASALGDFNISSITLRNISRGSILVEWTNNSMPKSPCPAELIQAMCSRISDSHGLPSSHFLSAMEPEFKPMNIRVHGTNKCEKFSFVPSKEFTIPVLSGNTSIQISSTVPASSSSGWSSSDDVYLHTVIPAVVVAALLLTSGFIAMACYRKKRRGKLTTEEQATFIKKGVPIIFADELDDAKSQPSASMPLILREEKPPLPPPQYSGSACGEGSLINHQFLEEYISLNNDDPSALPYQPPPPFTVPIEGRGSRPKNMTAYRCPPPYVPP